MTTPNLNARVPSIFNGSRSYILTSDYQLISIFVSVRKHLASENGKRKKFVATFERIGKKVNYKGYSEETILLKNIIDVETKKVVADHVWFSFTKGFEKISLSQGMMLEFEARVKEYKKGYVNTALNLNKRSTDFKLSHPTKIQRHLDFPD